MTAKRVRKRVREAIDPRDTSSRSAWKPDPSMQKTNPPLRLVIFDVDGTLIDSQDFILAAMRRAFAAGGHPAPSDDATRGIVGLSHR